MKKVQALDITVDCADQLLRLQLHFFALVVYFHHVLKLLLLQPLLQNHKRRVQLLHTLHGFAQPSLASIAGIRKAVEKS